MPIDIARFTTSVGTVNDELDLSIMPVKPRRRSNPTPHPIFTGIPMSYSGSLFVRNTYIVVTDNSRFDAFIRPIVAYLNENQRAVLEISMETNIEAGKIIDGINDSPDEANSKRADLLKDYVSQIYGLPNTGIVINRNNNRAGTTFRANFSIR